MPRRADIAGQTFARLTAISRSNVVKLGQGSIWECRCDCGNFVFVSVADLRRGHTKSCGCLRREYVANNLSGKSPNFQTGEWVGSENQVYRQYQNTAKRKSREFDLTKEQFWSIATQDCTYCGAVPSKDQHGNIRNGLDRVDSSIGYRIDNVVPCCWICNTAKSDLNREEFLNHIKRIYNFNLTPRKEKTFG